MGIDVSKTVLDVHILPSNKYMQFKNDCQGINKLIKKLEFFPDAAIVMEATGGYEKAVAQVITKGHGRVSIVNPRQIKDFAKALGKLAKTDKIDAQVIALFAQKLQPSQM